MDYEKCSICREPMDGGSQPDYMLRCNHRFHVECIIDSLRKSRECPVCRDTGIDSPNQNLQSSFELEDVYDWNIELHQNCVCCASKDKNSEYYDTYNLIKEIGSNNHALLSDYKQVKTIKYNLVNSILKKYNKEDNKLTRKYDRERQLLYRSLANEPDYKEYKEACHKYRGSKLRIINAIWRELNGLGYEREEIMEKLVDRKSVV